MEDKKLKYELNEIVYHKTENSDFSPMLIVSRGFQESNNGTDEMYLVTFTELGTPRRIWVFETEIRNQIKKPSELD